MCIRDRFYTEMLFPQKGVRFIAVNDNVDSASDKTHTLLREQMCIRDSDQDLGSVPNLEVSRHL